MNRSKQVDGVFVMQTRPEFSTKKGEPKQPPAIKRILFADLPCIYRGESRSESVCCGKWVQVAACSEMVGECTINGVEVGGVKTSRCDGCQLRKA